MKKVKSIRFFSVFLSLSILLGLCPTSATAEADQTDHVEQPQIPVQTETVDNTSTYVIPNGTYYIKNRGNGSYLHAPTGSLGKVLLSDHQNSENQKWTITQVSNGKYFITSAQSGALAISGSTPTDGAFVYTEPNMAQPRFWWSIERTESGSFKIQCSTAASYDYVLKDGDTIAGRHYAANGEYCDDTDFLDEWYISDSKYTYSVTHYYDQGYICRFATEDTTAFELIRYYQDTASEILLDRFALKVEASYYTRAASAADTCKTLPLEFEALDDFCNHSVDHLSRHSNVSGIAYGTPTTTKVVWTGHILYARETDENGKYIITDIRPSGSYADQYKIIITPSQTVIRHDVNDNELIDEGDYCENKPQSEIESESIFSLLHEISHQLGALDHRCPDPDSEGCPNIACYQHKPNIAEEKCVMYQRFDITAENSYEDIYCEFCIDIIEEHLLDHHVQ